MDNLFALNGGQGRKANHIQGLFHDLLACLAGGDNPRLPLGYKMKPMTGFCAILDAFNEVIKSQEAGSGLVSEVGSSETVRPNSNLSKDTLDGSDARPSTNATSSQSLHNGGITASESRLSAAVNHLQKTLQKYETPPESRQSESANEGDDDQGTEEEPSEFENFQDAEENPVLALIKSRSSIIEDVGSPPSPASVSGRSVERPDSAALKQYSDKIRQIEMILKAHWSPGTQFLNEEFPVSEMSPSMLMGHGILPTFPDPSMNPGAALEKMYETESAKSGANSPVAAFKSCTSICGANANERTPTSRTPNSPKSPISPRSPRGILRRTNSTYVDCLNMDESTSNADFIAAIDAAIRQGEIGKEKRVAEIINRKYKAQQTNANEYRKNTRVSYSPRESDINNNAYYSTNEDSSDGKEFHDASTNNEPEPPSLKQQNKRKVNSRSHQITPPREKTWRWISTDED